MATLDSLIISCVVELTITRLDRSREEFEEAKQLITGGVHSGFRYREPFPLYFQRAEGSRVWDIDGNQYTDYLVGNGAVILGHKDPRVTEAVRAQLDSGLTVSLESELSFTVARALGDMIPSAKEVKLSNTGTEAVMHAVQIARGYTGRGKILKTEGCYHGWHDEANFSVHPAILENGTSPAQNSTEPVPESVGLASGSADNLLVVPYNDIDALEKCIKDHRNQLAALIIEPIVFNSGCIKPKDGYLQSIREITRRYDVLLIFDEVISGFRISPGGAQAYYGVIPDISVFGKAIANGFPLSAVVGQEEVMKITTPRTGRVPFSGTYNGNQPSLAASLACLEQLRDGSVQRKLWSDSETLAKRFEESCHENGVNARLQTAGGQFQIYFTEKPVMDYTDAAKSDKGTYEAMCRVLFESGILFHQSYLFHHGVSKAHSSKDVEGLCDSLDSFIGDLKKNPAAK